MVKITAIWSDQLPNRKCNYLPGKSGQYSFILAGCRSDNAAEAKAQIEITPNDPSLWQKLIVRLAYADFNSGQYVPVGSGSLNGNIASMSLDGNDISDPNQYSVLAWLDLNQDGKFDPSEPHYLYPAFRFVTQAMYNDSFSYLEHLNWLSPYPTAYFFLYAFLNDTPTEGATWEWSSISANDPSLSHNVGVVWQTDCSGPIRLNYYASNSSITGQILNALPFKNQVIGAGLDALKPTVQAYVWQPGEDQHTFVGPMPSSMNFELNGIPPDDDLHYAFGHVQVAGNLTATVRRSDLELTNLDLSGFIYDLYDFDFLSGGLAEQAARVQAGYNTLGTGGHIFREKVDLTTTGYSYSYNFN